MSVRAKFAKIMLRHQLSGWSEGSIEEQRAKQEKAIRFARLPADIRCQPVSANGVPAEWIGAPDSDLGVILYLHGGAYTLGSINTHRELVARLARAANWSNPSRMVVSSALTRSSRWMQYPSLKLGKSLERHDLHD